MGYLERIKEIKEKLNAGKPIWVPERKVLVIPPNFLIWLGAEESQLCRVACSTYRLARYVLTGEAGGSIEISIATDEELRWCREALDTAAKEIGKIEEPYRSRLSEILVFKKLKL